MVESGREKVSTSYSSYGPKDLHFFKVFLPEFSSRELVIPPAFIGMLEKPLPNEVSLLDEIGRLWSVESKTEDRVRVSFKKGWELIAKDLSLEFGDFLVFRYDAVSRFFVAVFAKDGCKKDLRTSRSRVSVDNEPVRNIIKPIRVSVKEEPNVTVDIEPEKVPTIKTKPEQHYVHTRTKLNRPRDPCGISSWVPEKKHRVIKEPKNPHFVRNITQRALCHLEIPTTFLKSNCIVMEEDVELCDENGKKWPLKIVSHDRGFKFSKDSWLTFCKNHVLTKPNKCLFEFIVGSNGICKEIQVCIISGDLLTTITKNNYQVLAM
ncbi:unnamed protein product [Cochlearia groenlandica]